MTGRGRSAGMAIVARWPLAIAVVSWRYLWRTTPLHRSDEVGNHTDLPPAWDLDDEEVDLDGRRQGLADGIGPLVHRRYTVWITGSTMSAATLMDAVAASLNRASPEIATFVKTRGSDGPVRDGDEYVVRMPGPWNGPVRAIREPMMLRLLTLNGHLEAGQIEFRASVEGDALRFDIESWTRAGDRLAELLYNRLRVAKEIQLNMWTHFCLRTAAVAGGRPRGGVTIVTRSLPWSPPADSPRH